MLPEKEKTSFNLTVVALKLIEGLTEKMGISKTAVVETAIRDFAEKKGIEL